MKVKVNVVSSDSTAVPSPGSSSGSSSDSDYSSGHGLRVGYILAVGSLVNLWVLFGLSEN
ncbi:hypothetical protein Bca52824_030180 [Brassica carinata]|uniref:Uncharacterized protein n=1 Tax=Brassica carinata TaxID=52824 RepID=A0A8X7V438_BRACI|nr:hypothetical protein Bca52824_030180 [Brassica carinata]